jgi:hypothetical protein
MYYASIVNVFSNVDLNIGEQEFSITEVPELLVERVATFGDGLNYTDITGIVGDSADVSSGLVRIPLEPAFLSDANLTYADTPIIDISRQYGSMINTYNIRPPFMDADSAGTGLSRDSDAFVDVSNAFERIDGNVYEDSDGQIVI